jgi:predicted transcriptional regulator
MNEGLTSGTLLPMAGEIVAAHVSNNKILPADIPQLIRDVYLALAGATSNGTASTHRDEPAISVKKSVSPDYLVCLEDGFRAKTLRRHLRTAHGLSPEEYRRRWNLPGDYPMVAPNYAKTRSRLAKQIGLGTTRRQRKTQKRSNRLARSRRTGRR